MSEINPEELELDLADRALEEAMALLADVHFSTSRGAYRQGELSAVSVMLDEDSEAGVHHIRVMCHDPGHLGIDWDGLPLTLIERPSGKNWPGFLDLRGRAEFRVAVSDESDLGFGKLNPNGIHGRLTRAARQKPGELHRPGDFRIRNGVPLPCPPNAPRTPPED